MSWMEYGAYAGIIGGTLYFFLLFAFRDFFAGRDRISWIIQLEMAAFMVLTGFVVFGITDGNIPFYVLGAIGWIWLAVVIVTVLLWLGSGSKV
ncbi:hypothetical protein E3E36_07390 [Thermococcus sp. M36]|uniref:hypothetical protein n=1 Tax=Thermococcus sp. M36 TaxID=1638261 RepID=UPI00143C7D80|nr:hypothetical protein [Thermococcus sp. M36]NJE05971.1 hypothetical protein [Thermococcus sp. M36]